MRVVKASALVPFSAGEMFALVDDIEAYPEFLPWCSNASVHVRKPDLVEASLELQRGNISKSFRTRNALDKDASIELSLLDGPFRHFSGAWKFHSLGDEGCKVQLNLDFEFDSFMTDVLFGRFFEDTCSALVGAFTERAEAIYGKA